VGSTIAPFGRLHVSQPPFSKQIHDLENELLIELFERKRKGVALMPAGKSFLIDARRNLEDCDASIRKAQRINRGELGELAIGYMSALTHDFLDKALARLKAFACIAGPQPECLLLIWWGRGTAVDLNNLPSFEIPGGSGATDPFRS